MHFAHNPFKVAKENIDFTEYKEEVERFIEKYINPLKNLYNWIEIDEVKECFWKLVHEIDVIHPNNWKVNICYFLGRILALKALLHIGKIIQQVYDLNIKWFDYLLNRFSPHITKISNEFLGKIYDNIPVMDLPQAKSLLDRMVKVYGTNNLIEVLQNPEISITDKIRAFDENYRLHYGYFLTRCQHIGDELNKFENPNNLRNWGSDLRKIFFLERNHNKTPPFLIEFTLIELIHIRNALSHIESGGFFNINEDLIKIIDRNSQGIITFERIVEVEDLWKFYYELINLDRTLDIFALFVQACLQLKIENENNVVIFNCSCGNVSKTYISPETKNIVCTKCFKIYRVSDLKKLKIKRNP
ncbi:MAG: hypothetical protein ACFFDF_22645 [Candidatus Odinarchaeota archaeon]